MPKLADYLGSIDFRNPVDAQKSLFHYANQTDMGLFEWLQTQPDQLAIFSAAMKASTKLRRHSTMATISSQYPVKSPAVMTNGTPGSHEEEKVLLVDVGGGRGQIIQDVRLQRPELKGRMIVQDLSQEIVGREAVNGVEAMSYDFFTPQPIKGAL